MSAKSTGPPRRFKGGVDADENRRRRGDSSISVRKEKREQNLRKLRRQAPNQGSTGAAVAAGVASGAGKAAEDESALNEMRNLPALVAALYSNNLEAQIDAANKFRRILSTIHNPPTDTIVEAGVIPRLVEFLDSTEPTLQFEAAWALTNIASGLPEQTQVVVEAGAVPKFVQILATATYTEVREQAVWALGNVAGDSVQLRNYVLEQGVLPHLLAVLEQTSPPPSLAMQRNGTWALSNLCRGKPAADDTLLKRAHILMVLYRLLYSPDVDVLTDALWTLAFLSDGDNAKIQDVIEAGCVHRVVELLGHAEVMVRVPALRTVGNIVSGDDMQTQVVLNCGALPALLQLLQSSKHKIRKEACWTISNITAGVASQIRDVLDANLIPPLIHLLSTAEFDIRKEAAWAISNATEGASPEHMRYMVGQGCIPPLCALLNSSDDRIIFIALEALANILRTGEKERVQSGQNAYALTVEEAGGCDYLEELLEHESTDVYNQAAMILERFFSATEVDDAAGALAPQAGAGFGSGAPVVPDGGFNF